MFLVTYVTPATRGAPELQGQFLPSGGLAPWGRKMPPGRSYMKCLETDFQVDSSFPGILEWEVKVLDVYALGSSDEELLILERCGKFL